ncbi:DNA topoisomerase 2 top-2-like [Daphnia pulicaria]|uniref:DNA topoisomerase 2 top-2-like n=1 Tax=Daphnia pulicaria TaxID=35523 RepID=UPI001EEC936B|nr:DNA topoisomerase 2 top-2-like [Daphnia pulicaria]
MGSMTSEEVESAFTNLQSHRVIFNHNGDDDDRAISMAFSKRHSGQHRDWLDFWNKASKWLRESPYPKLHLYRRETRQVSFYEFVHRGLVRYTNMEHERYIRSIMDGLTVGQRKIIFTCIKRSDKEEVTVAQLAGLVAARTSLCNYGEENLTRTIIGLAHDFVGTNNINLLQPIGHFGTRLQGGEDAASPRQISTLMSRLTRIIFHPYDDRLLKHRTDGKRLIEPEFYAPIIPMILVNGIDGIGSTDRTTSRLIYNPREIIGNIVMIATDLSTFTLFPELPPFCFPILLVSVSPYSTELDDIASSSESFLPFTSL